MIIIKTAFQISQPKFSLQLQKDTKPTKDILKGSLWVNTQIPSKFKVKVCLLEKGEVSNAYQQYFQTCV